jgi:hypothetical protein
MVISGDQSRDNAGRRGWGRRRHLPFRWAYELRRLAGRKRRCIEPVRESWLGLGSSCGALGEAPDHLDDGGPVDHGLVMGGEALVVAGAAPEAADSGVGALDAPAAAWLLGLPAQRPGQVARWLPAQRGLVAEASCLLRRGHARPPQLGGHGAQAACHDHHGWHRHVLTGSGSPELTWKPLASAACAGAAEK